ncbi:hypothetical protein ACFC0M_02120 [Streptomyces sp. NPDC056149]|uniref:hypothetical protein n=1 Tax=unclassified Streptomyces TaxID=2593676 RepID=UPI002380DBEB|nr:hypothetical protein [Streptomyces sp. WZ-12]
MTIGLLSAAGVTLYAVTVSVLAFTSAFARRAGLRREARATLAVLVLAGSPQTPHLRSGAGGDVVPCLGGDGGR